MAVWQQPVFDRTAEDLAAGDEKCCFSPQLLDRIEGNTEVLAGLFGVRGLAARRWQATDFLTAGEMQRILCRFFQRSHTSSGIHFCCFCR